MEQTMRETLERVEIRQWVIVENGGQQIFGVLHRPTSVATPPIVVILHGFASSKHGSNRCYVTLSERLAMEGIASLRFDFRGSGDSEGVLSDITFDDLISDAVSVVDHLEMIGGIDVSRIAFFGASLGGSLAILAAARVQKIKTMALWSPVASGELWFRDFLRRHPELANADREKILSSYRGKQIHPRFREQFAQMFAYKTIQQLHPLPILHMQGEKDDTISLAHQEAFKQASPPQHSQVRFLKYPDGQHSLGYSESFPEVVKESIEWFQRNL
jgi:uncharacterized protein